jgi:hypothetical protein
LGFFGVYFGLGVNLSIPQGDLLVGFIDGFLLCLVLGIQVVNLDRLILDCFRMQ